MHELLGPMMMISAVLALVFAFLSGANRVIDGAKPLRSTFAPRSSFSARGWVYRKIGLTFWVLTFVFSLLWVLTGTGRR